MSASIVFTSRFELRRDAIEGKGIRTWSVFAAFQSSGNCSRHRNNDFKCHALTKALRLLVECLGSGSSYNQRLKEEKRGGHVVLEDLVASLALFGRSYHFLSEAPLTRSDLVQAPKGRH